MKYKRENDRINTALLSSLAIQSILFVLPTLLQAQTTGTLQGKVIDSDSVGIAGAVVHSTDKRWGAVTKANGTFTIQDIPAGEYIVQVRCIGKKKVERTVQINPQDTTTLFVLLEDDYIENDGLPPPKKNLPKIGMTDYRIRYVDPETTGKVTIIDGRDLVP